MNRTNFFTQLAQMDITGTIKLTIAKTSEQNMVVSILVDNEICGDNAKKMIPPLNIKGTSTELDEGFFESVRNPIEKASGLQVDMENYLKNLENIKKQSAMEKDKTEKRQKQVSDTDKKIADALKKAEELEKVGKYRQAWSAVPEPNEYPERAEELLKRRGSLTAKFAPDLFGEMSETKESESQVIPPNVGKSQNDESSQLTDSFDYDYKEEEY